MHFFKLQYAGKGKFGGVDIKTIYQAIILHSIVFNYGTVHISRNLKCDRHTTLAKNKRLNN